MTQSIVKLQSFRIIEKAHFIECLKNPLIGLQKWKEGNGANTIAWLKIRK
jgi:hypothetical protein